MKTTKSAESHSVISQQLEDELAKLSAQVSAATARWLELVVAFRQEGGAAADDLARWLAFRCGISGREARQYVLVAEALQELPLIRAAFARGELTFSKVRALTRVATAASEQGLLELAEALTACQLERALRAFRRLRSEEARDSHELEYVDHHWAEDGSLVLRARLPAEEGTLLVRALEAARARVRERAQKEHAAEQEEATSFEPPRSPQVEAVIELARSALTREEPGPEAQRAQLVVHVDAAALTHDGAGRSELAGGPVISPATARRLGCDAETVTVVEQDGLPLSVGADAAPCRRSSAACSTPATMAAAAGRGVRGLATSTPTTERTGHKAARRASTTSSCSAGITTAWCTRAGTRSRTATGASFGSVTATASSVQPCHAPRRGTSMASWS